MANQINSPLDGAIYAVCAGFKVFPCEPGGKRPAPGIRPTQDATADFAQVERWWKANPQFNVGLVTTGWLVVDVDKADALASLPQALPETRVHTTPSGGRHLIYSGADVGQAPLAPGLDVRSHNGYIVGPGSTINGKRYEIADAREPVQAPAWLVERQGPPGVKKPDRHVPIGELDTPGALQRAAAYLANNAEPAVSGAGGNDTRFKVAARVRDFGVSEERCFDLVLAIYDPRCFPPWSSVGKTAKLRQVVANAYGHTRDRPGNDSEEARLEGLAPITGLVAPTNTAKEGGIDFSEIDAMFPTFDPFEDVAAIPKRPWVVRDMLLRGQLSTLVAPPGAGKSTFYVALAAALQANRSDLIGYEICEPGGTIIANLEDPETEQKMRWHAFTSSQGIDPRALAKGVHYLDRTKTKGLFYVSSRTGKAIGEGPALEWLRYLVRTRRPKLVVLDPFKNVHGLDENDNSDINAVTTILADFAAKLDVAVLLVHHTRKPPEAASTSYAGNMDTARGASALGGATRWMGTIYGMAQEDAIALGVSEAERRTFLRVDDAKNSYGEKSDNPRWFRRGVASLPNGEKAPYLVNVKLEPYGARWLEMILGALAPALVVAGDDGVTFAEAAETLRELPLFAQLPVAEVKRQIERVAVISRELPGGGFVVRVEERTRKGGKPTKALVCKMLENGK